MDAAPKLIRGHRFYPKMKEQVIIEIVIANLQPVYCDMCVMSTDMSHHFRTY